MTVGNAAELSALRDGVSAFAIFASRSIDLETTEVPSIGGARVRVVAATKDGVSFEGWMPSVNLHFEIARDVELAPKTAWIPRGAPVSIVVGAGRKVVVSPWTKDIERFEVSVGCDAVAIGEVPRAESASTFAGAAPPGASSKERILALVRDTLPIAAAPGGDAVFTLHGGVGLRVPVIETADGLHVHFEDGLVVDGWIRAEDVASPTTHRMHAIGCGMGIAIGAGLPPTASMGVARKETPIFVGETAIGAARGSIAKGGRVIVARIDGAFAEVLLTCGELVPAAKQHFWVEASALEIGEKVPTAGLRAACK